VAIVTAGDITQMIADLQAIRDDNAVSVALRRGATTLSTQTIRIAQAGRQAANVAGNELEASILDMTVLGATTLDIQPGDRFTSGSVLYEVTAVAANKRSGVRARARMVQ
jgi:hypothetical protein